MNKKREFIDFEEELSEYLKDSKKALLYLNAALMDDDPRTFLLALKDVLAAQGDDMTSFSKASNLNRENLYRIFSKNGNPKLTSIRSILDAMGLELTVQAHRNS